MRQAGILMAITSLPSEYGIGCFSKEAYEFIDALKASGQSVWQILPLGPTSYGDSPYQSFSTFAGNPYFIDPGTLIEKGLITKKKCDSYDFGNDPERVDYAKIYASRFKLLREAFNKANKEDKEFGKFEKNNSFWIEDYALYMAVKASFDNRSWQEWDDDIRLRKPAALKKYKEKYKEDIRFYKYLQFEFYNEWKKLKSYANSNGISIVGDIPIYVALDSADAWANPELFQFDEDLRPKAQAGCPPDGFSATGQLWGNPLYDWEYHKKTGYDWWIKRLFSCFELYDTVRIDHFRGFDEYYSIPFPAENAVNGHWEKGPGYDLFKAMKEKLGKKDVIAEDLGFLTPSVLRLVKKSGYPGMKVLQFAFDSREESDYLPHNYNSNSVVYTGTHDNDTTLNWFLTLRNRDRKYACEYLNIPKDAKKSDIPWFFIRAAYSSVSSLCVIPMQDILSLPAKARMNRPSTLGGNWEWRIKKGAFSSSRQKKLLKITQLYRRVNKASKR
ncbi:MAG: 4-alpha-glucanotransferase [Lachnospiraceae bacterium]|nr:4-alpha-glucanotransferase [Lachnospiraceae bacterium]